MTFPKSLRPPSPSLLGSCSPFFTSLRMLVSLPETLSLFPSPTHFNKGLGNLSCSWRNSLALVAWAHSGQNTLCVLSTVLRKELAGQFLTWALCSDPQLQPHTERGAECLEMLNNTVWINELQESTLWSQEMAAHSSNQAWEISWTEKPGRLQSMGSQRVGLGSATKQEQQQPREVRGKDKNPVSHHSLPCLALFYIFHSHFTVLT